MYAVNQGCVTWYSLECGRFVMQCHRSLKAHAPALHATSHFDHERRFAWCSFSMHVCMWLCSYIYIAPPELRYYPTVKFKYFYYR